MTLTEKYSHSAVMRLFCALLLNAVFLAAALIFIAPAFEANDDLTLAAFADGQMSIKCTYIPYINYVLALILNGIYRVLGESAAWHTIGQYTLLFISFTAISWVFFERLHAWQAAVISIIMLLFIGVDCYMIISYTKTAGVCAVGGMSLIFLGAEFMPKGKKLAPIIVGIILCLFGFMLRKMEFLPCMAIMAVLGLRWLYKLLFNEKALSSKEKFSSLCRYAAPFILMLALCGGLTVVDKAAWSKEPWREFAEFDAVRVAYSDYGRPEYKEMPQVYDDMGLTESAVSLLHGGNYFDPDNFTQECMQQISDARDANFPHPSVGECLGKLLDTCFTSFFVQLPVFAFVMLFVLWLAAGEHDLCGMLTAAGIGGLFALFYMYLIYRGRYLIDRVDVCLFLAMYAALAWMLKKEKLQKEKMLSIVVLLVALYFANWKERSRYRTDDAPDYSAERAAVDTLINDTEHIYLAKLDTVNDMLYPPFTPAPAGYWDRIILLGGWDCNHPAIMANLAKYGVKNPYRDLIGNDRAYIIDDDIDLTLQHIHDYYCPEAKAELVEPLSTDTGLAIYRILTGRGDAA